MKKDVVPHTENFRIVAKRSISYESLYKKSREAWGHYTKRLEVAPSPLHVDIELTNICDIDCIMCERRLMRRLKGMMPPALFKKIVRECSEIGVDSLKLNLWGESLLNKKLIEMIRYAKQNSSLILQFNTNGNRMTADVSKGLVRAGLDKITISLDGITNRTYEKIRKGGDLDRVTDNINALVRIKKAMRSRVPYVTVQIIEMTENKDEIDAFVNYWKNKVDFVSVTNISATTADKDILRLSTRSASCARKPCVQLWQRLSVLWDGTITVCCNDYDGFLAVGNIARDSLLDIWHSKRLSELRGRHVSLNFESLVCDKCTETYSHPSRRGEAAKVSI